MDAVYFTPAITLFHEDGRLDLVSQKKLYDNLIENGIDGILVEGSSSEFFAMNMEQRKTMAKFAIDAICSRVKLVIGTTSMVADETVSFSNFCLKNGADAVMILPPYYFQFGSEALFQYYDRLASMIDGPMYLYNFPQNTGCTIPAETVLELAEAHGNIIGIKDTIAGMDHTRMLIELVKGKIPSFEIYSGYDDNFAHNVLSGGNGCIGSLSNVVPAVCADWVKAIRKNDIEGIAKGQKIINRLMRLYTIRSPFLPVLKEALKLQGVATSSTSTFPMPDATAEDDAKILELLRPGCNGF
ncbi:MULTISPECIES: dihydrodipicolinate synthase family protein [Acutalibacteraceae]|uniref:dihydrodipicolinate synthase family protein n=1 Tax=Acutalibacteraceae TaxID=3082771 RepID=UPI0013E8C999|nr:MULTISPECIES: dihydrodipicolinate synthase family protein [Acutalibacteraceae]